MAQQMVEVTVPKGVEPNQDMTFRTPDGQTMSARVPPGIGPGQSFQVQYAPVQQHPQIVQATVVGSAPAPMSTVVGTPMGVPNAGMYQSPYGAPNMMHSQDQQAGQTGWILYLIGWAGCCFCGPIGPVVWFFIACLHFCKPPNVRQNMVQERQVAMTSLITGITVVILVVALIILFLIAGDRSESR